MYSAPSTLAVFFNKNRQGGKSFDKIALNVDEGQSNTFENLFIPAF